MRAKRYLYLAGVVVLALVAVEMVFQPVGRSPQEEAVSYEFVMAKPFSELAEAEGPQSDFQEVAQEYVDKQKKGEFLVSTRESDNVLVVDGDARTKAEARAKGQALQKALAKEWPGTSWDQTKFKSALKDLSDTPQAKLGPLALYRLKMHLNYGLDLQGGVHLVLQCRRALFEYAIPEGLGKTPEERLETARKVRELLRRRGDLVDMEVALPPDKPNAIQIRTQAEDQKQLKAHQKAIDEVLSTHFAKFTAREPQGPYEIKRDTMDRTIEIIRMRVDKLGVSEPVIQRQGLDRVVVQLAGVYDPKEAIDYIGTTAMLEFRKIPERYKPEIEQTGDVEKVFFVDKKSGDVVDPGQVYDEARTILIGENLKPESVVGMDEFGAPTCELEFTKKGKELFGNFTRRNVKKYLGIFLDGKCISAPIVNEPITGGQCRISGGFGETKEAKRLADLLNAGALPIPIDVVEERTVTATLGADSLHKSTRAGLWGLLALVVFMVAYYRLPGVLAGISLSVYCILVFAVLVLIDVTLTLPGIAGFILSIGMAVDANVIIFERLKEELRTNKTFKSAVDAGFNRAWTAILDSQVTTLIAAAVLFVYGTGPIQGFALTLIVGVVCNLFTAIAITRLFMHVVADTALSRARALYFA